MGMLVGNTTVIEHAGTYVEYSRTYSHVKYAPAKHSIGFILPKGVLLSDGYLLARAIVNAQLGLEVKEAKKADALCQLVFDQKLIEFYVEAEVVVEKTQKRRIENMINGLVGDHRI